MNKRNIKSFIKNGRKFTLLLICLICFPVLWAQGQRVVTGTVFDANRESLIGVNVMEKGTSNGTVTDIDGKFSLRLSGNNPTLVISFIGYIPQEVPVSSRSSVDVVLAEDTKTIEEVVVVGYGTNSKRNLITAVSTVDANKMAAAPVANITDALAGRTAGLIVTQSGGGIGKSSAISVRGGGTPLVVIDGFIVPYSDFQNINMNDIESMSVLKDASATAVYGARAGDGILVVKTKGGVSGGLHVDYTYSAHFSEPTFFPRKLNSVERSTLDNDIRAMYGLEPRWTNEEMEKFRNGSDPYNYPNTDWKKELLRNYAPETKHAFNLRGGSETNKYYVSFQAYDQQSLFTENSNYLKRYNATINQSTEFKEIGLKLGFELNGYVTNQRNPSGSYRDVFNAYLYVDPRVVAYNRFGQRYSPEGGSVLGTISLDGGYTKQDRKVVSGTYNAEWQVYGVEGLSLKASGIYRYEDYNEKNWNRMADEYDLEGNKRPLSQPYLRYNMQADRQYTVQFFADYKRSFAEAHNIAATFGYEANYTFGTGLWASRRNYIFFIDQLGAGPSDTMENGASEAESGRAGFIGRLAYNYKQKYYVEGSLRRDGSDLFPADRRWGMFYAGSVGYAVSEEKFFLPLKEKVLNLLKIRASYGQTGLDSGVDRFSYLTSYGLNERGYVVGGKTVPTFSEGALVSSDITWFTRNTTNAGIDFSSLNSRLSGSLDYFFMKTTGYLSSPSSVGYADPLGLSLPVVKSDGEHRREGFELALSWKDNAGALQYEVGGNFTYFDQLIAVAYNEDLASQKNPYRRLVQQRGYYDIGFISQGYYQNSDDVMNSPRRPQSFNLVAGDIKYQDTNGDGNIDDADQRRYGKNSMPRGNYGAFANLEYKGFFLNILFQGATSRDMRLYGLMMGMLGENTGQTSTFYDFQADYWLPDNRNSLFPRIGINSQSMNGNNNYQRSDFWLIDGRYVRLKSLQAGYNFKSKLLRNIKWISKLELALSGQNLLTWSPAFKYGLDPENGSTNQTDYPLQRTYAISLNIGF